MQILQRKYQAAEATFKSHEEALRNKQPVSTFIEEHRLYLGHLAKISRRGVRRVEFELTEEEARLFQRSAEVVRRAIEDV